MIAADDLVRGDRAEARPALPPSSLIIPSRNRPDMLAESVASILQGDEVPTELIILDQSDAPHEALAALTTDRACAVHYRWLRTVGLSRAMNEGVEVASHDIIVFTHDDVLAAPSWFGTLVRALEAAGPRTVVTGQVPPAEKRPGGFVPSTKVDPTPATFEGRIGEDVLYPLNMAMYRSLIRAVGDFDVRLGPGTPYPAAEDNDFCFRLLEAGYRILYEPQAVIYHRAWRSNPSYLPLRWSYGRGQGAFYAKHMSLRDRHMIWRLIVEIKHRVGRLVRAPRRAAAELVYLSGVISGISQWLLTTRKSS